MTPAGTRAERALDVLDAAIVACAGVVALFLALGRFELGVLSVGRLSKPLLVLLALAGLRLAIPTESWLSRARGAAVRRACAAYAGLARRTPWAPALLDAAVAALSVHVVARGTAFLANVLFLPARERPFPMPFEAAKLAETFAAWDSGWYFEIARSGYHFDPAGQSSIAFFPLYPLLMRALAWPFGGGERALWIAGIVLSNACLLLALALLHRLTLTLGGDREAARRTLLYVAVFPFAYFFTDVYTESLFLLLTVGAAVAAVSGGWGLAGVLGGLAALSRPNGVLIAVPLGLLALSGRPRPGDAVRRLLALSLVPLGLGLFCWYCHGLSGDAFAWLHAQGRWGYSVGNRPWVELMRLLDGLYSHGPYGYFFSDPLACYYFLHGTVALAVLVLVPSVFVRVGPAWGAYVALSLFVPLTGNALEGIGRYAATLFPLFVLLGRVTSRRAHETLLIASALVLSLLSSLFVTLHPIY